jgi:hypothetical protein
MDPVFKKMTVKDQPVLLVVQPPASFQPNLDAMAGITSVATDPERVEKTTFALAFVTRQEEVDAFAVQLDAKLEGDGQLWFAYPKGTSKKYKCTFNRDNGWAVLGQLGYEPVRMIAIDEDWSALRFRRVQFIKEMKRDPKMRLT